MSLTITKVKHFNVQRDGVRESVFDITFDGSYPSGGYDLAATDFGYKGLYSVNPINSPGGFVISHEANKLIGYKVGSAGAMTVCATTDLQNKVVRVNIRGY